MKVLLEAIEAKIDLITNRSINEVVRSIDVTDLTSGIEMNAQIASVKKAYPKANVRVHYHRHDEGLPCTTEVV